MKLQILIQVAFLIFSFGIIRNYAATSVYLKINQSISNLLNQRRGKITVANTGSICEFWFYFFVDILEKYDSNYIPSIDYTYIM